MRIRGLAPSGQLNDVQIKATWTSADGAQECSDMLELTVVFVTLAFRPDEPYAAPREVWTGFPGGPSAPQDGSNDVPPLAQYGQPLLGAIAPGAPPPAQGFFKNIEISGWISPCIAGLGSVADFKRLRQGYDGVVLAVNGQPRFFTSPEDFPNHCPPPAWCDDDLDSPGRADANNDEDLAFDAPPACTVFVVDHPGFGAEASCTPDQIQFDVQPLVCFNFSEWLNLDGYRASRTLDWSASTGISCGQGGLWREGHGWVANRVGQSHKPFPALPPAGALPVVSAALRATAPGTAQQALAEDRQPAPGESDSAQLRTAIHNASSEDLLVRMRAMQQAYDLLEHGATVDIESRHELISALMNGDPHDPGPSFINYKRFAINILGQTGGEDAVRAIIPYISTQFPGGTSRRLWIETPAVRAMMKCGLAAVGPILERTGSASDEDWKRMTHVLIDLDTQSFIVRQTMRTVLDAQSWFEEVEAAGGVPQPDEAEKARRALVKQRLTEFLSTPEP
ncbi:MAG: hypothetical protein D6692_02300, partial [Planctomycetota bacterium]